MCTTKETTNKNQKAINEWEKIFANDMSQKGLISKIYKEVVPLNIKTKTQHQNKTKQNETTIFFY